MSDTLKTYDPGEKGRELIALLFPLSHDERENKLVEYQQQYTQEIPALLDGFHFLVQEVMEGRQAGMSNDVINLPDKLLGVIIGQMIKDKNFFSYNSIEEFFHILNKTSPSIFKDSEKIERALLRETRPASEKKSTSDLPEEYTEDIDGKLKTTCLAAQKAYGELSRIQRSLINSQNIIDSYKNGKSNISIIEVKLAKETFLDTKQVFLTNGKVIADGMAFIYEIYQFYPDQLLVKKAYLKYLAKLLGSREARYPPENYVLNLAKGDFDFSLPDFEPTDRQLQHGKTKYSLKKEYGQVLLKDIRRLESRYRKRKLTALLKTENAKAKIINELQEILKLDPGDIKTHIFIAKLMSDYSNSFNSHVKKGIFKEQALKHCQAAFSKIDDYLDLQEIKEVKERDIARASFVKTISAIRIPLLKKG